MALYWAVVPLFTPAHGQNSPVLQSSPLSDAQPSPFDGVSSRDSSPALMDFSNGSSSSTPSSTDTFDMELFKVSTASSLPSRRPRANSPQESSFNSPNSPNSQAWTHTSTGLRSSTSPMVNTAFLPTISEEATFNSQFYHPPSQASPHGHFSP